MSQDWQHMENEWILHFFFCIIPNHIWFNSAYVYLQLKKKTGECFFFFVFKLNQTYQWHLRIYFRKSFYFWKKSLKKIGINTRMVLFIEKKKVKRKKSLWKELNWKEIHKNSIFFRLFDQKIENMMEKMKTNKNDRILIK